MKRLSWLLPMLCAMLIAGCSSSKRVQRTLTLPDRLNTVDRKAPYLKVHMRDGSLYLLSPWSADEASRRVSGTGSRYDAKRLVQETGPLVVPIDSVVLFETNVLRPSPSVAVLAIISGITAGVAVYCLTNTKACFGSCPTFYLTDGTSELLQAEGFSASVAPSLEALDVDALFRAKPKGREVRIDMANEAYETHVVRYANLLVAPRTDGKRVMADPSGNYWSVTEPVPPTSCEAADGDCRAKLSAFDGTERLSAADSIDLATREFVDLSFDSRGDTPALFLASRQSLLPTYLLYQAFAWMGTNVGGWMAGLERADRGTAARMRNAADALGGIDVLVENGNGGWDSVATVRETGPLAADARLIPLPRGVTNAALRVRLRMAKGAWRIDAAALVSMGQRVTPLRLAPREVLAHGKRDDAARALLIDSTSALTTFPGDRYTLVYQLPGPAEDYELFLESKGYYLEWMRKEWLAEEDKALAASFFLDPASALRRLAPAFKRDEPGLENAFWRSKYAPR